MKVAAHPLVVAVAMGLLGPGALETEEAVPQPSPCVDCDEASAEDPGMALESTEVALAVDGPSTDVDGWLAAPEPTPEARARALAAYLATTAV